MTSIESNGIQQVLSQGFERARLAFNKLVSLDIWCRPVTTHLFCDDEDVAAFMKRNGDQHVWMTKLVGDLSGASFLILSDVEIQWLQKRNPALNDQNLLLHPFMAELDNILSAALISELSNALTIHVFGDVPEHAVVKNATQLSSMVHGVKPQASVALYAYSEFVSRTDGGFHPAFLWKFDKSILLKYDDIQRVSAVAKNSTNSL